MIESMRNRLQHGGIKIVLWLTLFSFAAGSLLTFFNLGRKTKADSIGTINDIDVGRAEFITRYEQIRHAIQEARQMYGPHADMILKMWGLDKKPQEAVVEGLISEKAVQSGAQKLNTVMSKEYLQSKLKDPFFVRENLGHLIPPQALTGGTVDTAMVKENLRRSGIAESDFEEEVQNAMERALFMKLAGGSIYVPRSELKKAYEVEFLKKKAGILTIPFEEYVKKARAQKITDAELEAYFDSNKEKYRIAEKRSAKVWTFEPESWGITIDDKDVESAYHKRKKAYIEKPEEREIYYIQLPFTDTNKIEVRRQAQELLKEVNAKPESFEAVAAKHSQSKDKGAKISLKRGAKDATFEKTAFGLQLNEISPVMETAEGFVIIKLAAKKDPVYKSLDKVKDTLLKSLKQEKFSNEFNASAQRVVRQATDMPQALTTFVTEKKAQASTSDATERGPSQKSQKIFGLSKASDRAFFTEGGKGYIVELTGITKSTFPQIASIKEKVSTDLYNDNARKLIDSELSSIVAAVKEGKETLAVAAKRVKGQYEQTDWLDPQKRDSLKKLSAVGIPAEMVMTLTKPNAAVTYVTPKNGVVAQILEIAPFNMKEFNDKKAALEYELQKHAVNSFLPALLESLRRNAVVKWNEDFIRQVG